MYTRIHKRYARIDTTEQISAAGTVSGILRYLLVFIDGPSSTTASVNIAAAAAAAVGAASLSRHGLRKLLAVVYSGIDDVHEHVIRNRIVFLRRERMRQLFFDTSSVYHRVLVSVVFGHNGIKQSVGVCYHCTFSVTWRNNDIIVFNNLKGNGKHRTFYSVGITSTDRYYFNALHVPYSQAQHRYYEQTRPCQ